MEGEHWREGLSTGYNCGLPDNNLSHIMDHMNESYDVATCIGSHICYKLVDRHQSDWCEMVSGKAALKCKEFLEQPLQYLSHRGLPQACQASRWSRTRHQRLLD